MTKAGVKLLDFGLAKMAGPAAGEEATRTVGLQTEEGTIVGTTPYMSPEQARWRAGGCAQRHFLLSGPCSTKW